MRNNPPSLLRGLAALCLTLSALCFAGCMAPTIDAASTRLKVTNVTGKSIEVTLPKNLDATKLEITVDPKTGTYVLKADKLVTDASTVIDSAAAAQAQAISNLSGTVEKLVPYLMPQIPSAPRAAPAVAPPVPDTSAESAPAPLPIE